MTFPWMDPWLGGEGKLREETWRRDEGTGRSQSPPVSCLAGHAVWGKSLFLPGPQFHHS